MIGKNDFLIGEFDSLGAFVDYAAQRPASNHDHACRRQGREAFSGTYTFGQAVDLAHGWAEGAKRIEEAAAHLNIKADRVRKEVRMSHVGPGVLNVGRYNAGHPKAVSTFVDGPNAAKGRGKVVRIVVNPTASAVVDKSVIENRGAAVMALCVALERAGRRVVIDVIHCVHPKGRNGQWLEGRRVFTVVHVKRAHERMNVRTLAFALMHPAFLRRLVFSARVVNPEASAQWFGDGRSGKPVDFDAPEGSIYLGALKGWEPVWETADNAGAWVRAVLKEQGVTLT